MSLTPRTLSARLERNDMSGPISARRTGFVAAVAALLLATFAAPAEAANPFGSFNFKDGVNAGGGIIRLHGWCLDDDGVRRVDVLVDGAYAGRASIGRARPGVTAKFPGFPDSALPGLSFALDSTRYLNGIRQVEMLCISNAGEVRRLGPKPIELINTTHTLVPFGRVDFPNRNARLYGNCDLTEPRRYSIVEGWALDSGVEIGDQGLGYVELLVDGAIVANSRLDCRFEEMIGVEGALVDCYGLTRPDIEVRYPTLLDSPNAGFRFALDVGFLIDFGFVRGHHDLTIRAGDIAGQVSNVHEVPVDFFCTEDFANEGGFGFIGVPRNGRIYSDSMRVSGWSLDWEGVAAVAVWVDGVRLGTANLGGARANVATRYPGYPDSLSPGFAFTFDTNQLTDGQHQMQVFVIDELGDSNLIGERSFFVDNQLVP